MYLVKLSRSTYAWRPWALTRGTAVLSAALLLLTGCSTPTSSHEPEPHRFIFGQDTFAYPNGLVWRYDFDPVTGCTTHQRELPASGYTHHCFVVARSARQFFQSARFDPTAPRADECTYRRLVKKVVATNPRNSLPDADKIVIPGYTNLFEFSADYDYLLKQECGGAWQSYFQRGHWRMIFGLGPAHQKRMAAQLVADLRSGNAPVVHVVRFPKLSINHAIVLFDCKETDDLIQFSAYDPNDPKSPVPVTFNRSEGRFSMPRTKYFSGGRIDVYEIYHAWNY